MIDQPIARLAHVSESLRAISPADADAAERRLLEVLAELGTCLVAFSGGVDSTYLVWAARQALGDRVEAVTAFSPSFPRSARDECRRLAEAIGVRHRILRTGEVDDERYRRNHRDRCYWCKSELYEKLRLIVEAAADTVVVDGTNLDDTGDFRPGRRAAAERGVRSPLVEAGIGKDLVRFLSRRADLPTWERPASPCLSSRVPYGMPVDAAKLAAVDRAEEALRGLGLNELRVRHLGDSARIEIAADELTAVLEPSRRRAVEAAVCRAGGFASAVVDREPFRSGRLNQPS